MLSHPLKSARYVIGFLGLLFLSSGCSVARPINDSFIPPYKPDSGSNKSLPERVEIYNHHSILISFSGNRVQIDGKWYLNDYLYDYVRSSGADAAIENKIDRLRSNAGPILTTTYLSFFLLILSPLFAAIICPDNTSVVPSYMLLGGMGLGIYGIYLTVVKIPLILSIDIERDFNNYLKKDLNLSNENRIGHRISFAYKF